MPQLVGPLHSGLSPGKKSFNTIKVSMAFQIPKMLAEAHCPIYSHHMGENMCMNIQGPVGQNESPY